MRNPFQQIRVIELPAQLPNPTHAGQPIASPLGRRLLLFRSQLDLIWVNSHVFIVAWTPSVTQSGDWSPGGDFAQTEACLHAPGSQLLTVT